MRKALAPIGLLVALAPGLAPAQTPTTPAELDPARVIEHVPAMPERGVTMERVLATLGDPIRRLEPVGDPPITRWVYDRFTVYFEYDRVLHSVKHNATY